MEYQRFAPHPRLREVVEHYWLVIAPAPADEIRAVLIPNGRATVQFCLGAPGHRLRPGATSVEVNADVLLPVTTDPYVLVQSGPSHYIGVQFTPWGAATVWPDAPQVPRSIDDVAAARPTAAALRADLRSALDGWLLAQLPQGAARGRRDLVISAVQLADQDIENYTVSSLGAALGVSTVTLYRAFRQWVGLSPKAYLSVRRYERFMSELLEQSRGDSPAMLAAAAGYADQAHAAREFRRHTGMTATEFRDRLDGIAEMMFRDVPAQ